ncbi:uncharacterized protein IL334_006898 [Kwoniella shivajii]|uniref:Uncharacterized protein n=1 Tax=Kwoniella shivajii TaxID=564305 RepID=A0ABZ1D7A2_9TREE|nr:hypothetical protein IL334_006898 [Kwoniella shivajii]
MTVSEGNSEDAPDTMSQMTKKRKHSDDSKPTRRALSCTECKRRKTKSERSPVIRVDVNPTNPAPVPSTVQSEVDALREQVNRLEKLVTTISRNATIDASDSNRPAQPTPLYNLEHAATSLEHFVVGPGVRPGITDTPGSPLNQSKIQPQATSSPLSWIYGDSSFDQTLLTILPRVLPNSPLGQQLVEDFFGGPIHIAWHQYSILGLDDFEVIVDPVWFAVYLMVLAFAIKFPHPNRLLSVASLSTSQPELLSTLQRASVKALDSSNYMSDPQISHIQSGYIVSQSFSGDLSAAVPPAEVYGWNDIQAAGFMEIIKECDYQHTLLPKEHPFIEMTEATLPREALLSTQFEALAEAPL